MNSTSQSTRTPTRRGRGVVPLRRRVPSAGVQGTLALDLHPSDDPPEVDLGPDAGARAGADVVSIDRAERSRLRQWSGRYVQAAVEIAAGDRPPAQLVRWTSPSVHADLTRRAVLVTRATGREVRGGVTVRPQVLALHTCFVSRKVAEVSAHVRYGERSRAVALRFERRSDRWLCTALEFA